MVPNGFFLFLAAFFLFLARLFLARLFLAALIGQKGEFGLLTPKSLDGQAREPELPLRAPPLPSVVDLVLERRLPPLAKHRLQSLDADPLSTAPEAARSSG